MMRIAFLLTQDRGGPVDVTVTLAVALKEAGATVRVFGPTPARGAATIADLHTSIAVPRKGDLGAARRALAAIRAWHPDVVHAQDRRAGLVATGLRGPVVHTYHGVPDDVSEAWLRGEPAQPPSLYTRTVLAADALVARRTTKTITPAPNMAEFLHRRLRVPANKLAHLDNCVPLPAEAPSEGPVRKLVFVGLLVPRKGLLNLLEALPPNTTLTVIGDGPQRLAAEHRAAQPDLAGRVTFLGFRQDVPQLLQEHDALVLPSTMEQQPLVVAEAMAAGKPVVATDTGGVADMLTVPGTPSYLAKPNDVQDLATQLRALCANPTPNNTGKQLAAQARKRYAPEAAANRHLELYKELLRQPTPAPHP